MISGGGICLIFFIGHDPGTQTMSEQDRNKTPYFDIKALSDYPQIKISTLYAWSAQNKIPSIKIHGVIRFRKYEIKTWLEGFRNRMPKEKSATSIPSLQGRSEGSTMALAGKPGLNQPKGKEK